MSWLKHKLVGLWAYKINKFKFPEGRGPKIGKKLNQKQNKADKKEARGIQNRLFFWGAGVNITGFPRFF